MAAINGVVEATEATTENVMSGEESERLVEFRLGALEERIGTLTTKLETAIGVLGGQMTSLQTTMTAFQQGLPEHYAPRREAQERHSAVELRFESLEHRIDDRRMLIDAKLTDLSKEVEQRFTDNVVSNSKRIDGLEARNWAMLVAVLAALGGVVLDWISKVPH